jgi:hypothetical protein
LVSVVALFPGVYRRVSADIGFCETKRRTSIAFDGVAVIALFVDV